MLELLKNLKTLDTDSDKWIIEYSTNVGDRITFDFSYLPNEWFKKVHKQITIENITLNRLDIGTLNRYNYSFKHFVEFLKKYNINITNYNDLTHEHIQMFLYYLKQQDISNSTRNVIISALKWVVLHGQHFEYEGFPKNTIFDGDEYKAFKIEDTLKTKYICN